MSRTTRQVQLGQTGDRLQGEPGRHGFENKAVDHLIEDVDEFGDKVGFRHPQAGGAVSRVVTREAPRQGGDEPIDAVATQSNGDVVYAVSENPFVNMVVSGIDN